MCVKHPHYKMCSFFEAVATINMWFICTNANVRHKCNTHTSRFVQSVGSHPLQKHKHKSTCRCVFMCVYVSISTLQLCIQGHAVWQRSAWPSSRTFSCLHMWVCVYNESGRVRRDSGLHLQVWWSLAEGHHPSTVSVVQNVFLHVSVLVSGAWYWRWTLCSILAHCQCLCTPGTNGQARCESCSDGRRIQMHTHVYTHPHPICLTHQIFSQSARSSIFTVGKIG